LHFDAKGELCTIKMYDIRNNVGDCTNQMIDQLIDRYGVKASDECLKKTDMENITQKGLIFKNLGACV